ncbi:MAG: type II toxin-antitoxin system RelE/ParE family toxin [Anaeromyxobacteraceae bacterium]
MRVSFSPAAARQADEIDLWWRDHRANAPDAFTEELASALVALAANPRLGALYARVKRPGVRRPFLGRTGYHLYYVVDGVRAVVTIRALWHSARGRGPNLGR